LMLSSHSLRSIYPLLFTPSTLKTHSPSSISTLSLHDALPISGMLLPTTTRFLYTTGGEVCRISNCLIGFRSQAVRDAADLAAGRSEEHTSELQSHLNLVCRLLLEKKKMKLYTFRINVIFREWI